MYKQEHYKLPKLQKIYEGICMNRKDPDPNTVPQLLNDLAKMVVWGDQNNPQFCEYICEVKLYDAIKELFTMAKDKNVINAVLGFFNLLLTNLSQEVGVNYLLSHPCIGSLQMTKFAKMNSEVADYYINFLKGLSKRVDQNSVYAFFNKRYCQFPLLMQTVRFYNHPENLVRTTCRNIVLSVAKISHPKIDHFVAGFPFCTYLVHECNFLKEYMQVLDQIVDSDEDKSYELDHMGTLVQDLEELLLYLDELVGVQKHSSANHTIMDRFIDAFVNEILSILVQSLSSDKKQHFGLKISLFVFYMFLKNFTHVELIEAVVLVMFGKHYSKLLWKQLLHPIPTLVSYRKEWKFKSFWDNHEQKVNQYCVKEYHSGSSHTLEHSSILSHSKIDGHETGHATNSNDYRQEIYKIEMVFGINLENSKSIPKSGGTTLKELTEAIKQEESINMQYFDFNPIRDTILSFLKSRDDSLVMITLCIIEQTLKKKKLSSDILQFCRFQLRPNSKDNQAMHTIQRVIGCCLQLFVVDPPIFRICTYKTAQNVILLLLQLNPQVDLGKVIPQLVKKALKRSIERLNPYIYSGNQWRKSIQTYYFVARENRNIKHKKSLKAFGLIPEDFYTSEAEKELKSTYDSLPREFTQQIGRDFWFYLIITEIYILLAQKCKALKPIIRPESTHPESPSKYVESQPYLLGDDEAMTAVYEDGFIEKPLQCQIILLGGFMVVGSAGKVDYKCSYQDCIIITDKSDPRKLFVETGGATLQVAFQNSNDAMELKKNFEEVKGMFERYTLSELVKEVEYTLTAL